MMEVGIGEMGVGRCKKKFEIRTRFPKYESQYTNHETFELEPK